jgi:hypothetical protein
MRDYADQIGCVAVVLGGGGFWASALQSFITGMRLVAPRSYDLRVHEHTDEVASWLPAVHHKRTNVMVDPHELRTVLRTVQMASPRTASVGSLHS